MDSLDFLFSNKYHLFKYLCTHCTYIKGEYVVNETFEQIAIETKIPLRTVARNIKDLENRNIITKYQSNKKKYCIPEKTYVSCMKLFDFVDTF